MTSVEETTQRRPRGISDDEDADVQLNSKRPRLETADADENVSSEDELGPMPLAPDTAAKDAKRKKARGLKHEKLYLDNLPSADMYERSLMHRDVVNFVAVTRQEYICKIFRDGIRD